MKNLPISGYKPWQQALLPYIQAILESIPVAVGDVEQLPTMCFKEKEDEEVVDAESALVMKLDEKRKLLSCFVNPKRK